jgi:hypothetical protein
LLPEISTNPRTVQFQCLVRKPPSPTEKDHELNNNRELNNHEASRKLDLHPPMKSATRTPTLERTQIPTQKNSRKIGTN